MVNVQYPKGKWKVEYPIETNNICRYISYPANIIGCQLMNNRQCNKEKCPIRVYEKVV